jgi:uncharacterized membrane protein
MTVSRTVLLLLVVLAIFQYTHFEPLLPDRVASHFGSSGQPNDWTSKGAYMGINLAAIVGFAGLFIGIGALTRQLPAEWINLPHKDYWLAPERRAATLDQFQRQMEWMGAGTVAFYLFVLQLTIEANLQGHALDNRIFWTGFSILMVATAVWVVNLIRWSSRRPPQASPGR